MKDRGPGDMYTNPRIAGDRYDTEKVVSEILTHDQAIARNRLLRNVPLAYRQTVHRLVEQGIRKRLSNGSR